MIITNFIAMLVIKFMRFFIKGSVGFALWPFIFIWPEEFAKKDWVIKHENKHLEQYRRYYIIFFPPIYWYYLLKDGYINNKFEIEARKAEHETFHTEN